jgi:hypothetical protein
MNPEQLIAMLKSLFGVAELSPEAMKNIAEMGAEAPEGMARLFRGEPMPGTIEGRGQMFTPNAETAARFAKNMDKEPMVNAIDVKDVAADHGNLTNKGVAVRDFGKRGVPRAARTDETVFLPKAIASGKKQIFPAAVAGATIKVSADQFPTHDDSGQPIMPGMKLMSDDGQTVEIIPTPGGPAPTVPDATMGQKVRTALNFSGARDPVDPVETTDFPGIAPGPEGGLTLGSYAERLAQFIQNAIKNPEEAADFMHKLTPLRPGLPAGAPQAQIPARTGGTNVLPSTYLPFEMGGKVQGSAVRGDMPGFNFSDKAISQEPGTIMDRFGQHSSFLGEGGARGTNPTFEVGPGEARPLGTPNPEPDTRGVMKMRRIETAPEEPANEFADVPTSPLHDFTQGGTPPKVDPTLAAKLMALAKTPAGRAILKGAGMTLPVAGYEAGKSLIDIMKAHK